MLKDCGETFFQDRNIRVATFKTPICAQDMCNYVYFGTASWSLYFRFERFGQLLKIFPDLVQYFTECQLLMKRATEANEL